MGWADVHASVDAHKPRAELNALAGHRGGSSGEAQTRQVQLCEGSAIGAVSDRKDNRSLVLGA